MLLSYSKSVKYNKKSWIFRKKRLIQLCFFASLVVPYNTLAGPRPQLVRDMVFGTRRSGHSRRGTTAKWNALTAKTMSISMPTTGFTLLKISKNNWLFASANTTISPCVPSTGARLNRFYLLSLMCNTSLTNLQNSINNIRCFS